jgi:hypothetical protein
LQFHQHFTRTFFVQKQIEQLFSSKVWLCKFLVTKYRQKCARKMLMKLTTEGNFTNILQAAFVLFLFEQKISNTNCKLKAHKSFAKLF